MGFHRTKILGLALLLAGLALCGTGLWLLLKPAQYEATVRIRVEPGLVTDSHNAGQNLYQPVFPEDFIPTECEIIQSPSILSNVVESLNLNVDWGKKYGFGTPLETAKTIKRLQWRMKLKPVRNTYLLDISFSSEDPNEAARIANAIAKSYSDYRMEKWKQLTRAGIQVLEEDYQKEEEQIRVLQTNVDLLRTNISISDINSPIPDELSQKQLDQINELLIEKESEYKFKQKQLTELRAMSKDKLLEALPTVAADARLDGLLSKLHEAKQQFASLTNHYSLTDTNVIRSQTQIDDLEKQIDERVDGIMSLLGDDVASMKAALDALTDELADAQADAIQKVPKNDTPIETYFNEKHKLEQMIEFHKLLAAKIEAAKMAVQNPKTLMVEIINAAQPPKSPVSQNRALGAVLLAIALFPTVGGFLLLKSSGRSSA